jgi:hypothetical protein
LGDVDLPQGGAGLEVGLSARFRSHLPGQGDDPFGEGAELGQAGGDLELGRGLIGSRGQHLVGRRSQHPVAVAGGELVEGVLSRRVGGGAEDGPADHRLRFGGPAGVQQIAGQGHRVADVGRGQFDSRALQFDGAFGLPPGGGHRGDGVRYAGPGVAAAGGVVGRQFGEPLGGPFGGYLQVGAGLSELPSGVCVGKGG